MVLPVGMRLVAPALQWQSAFIDMAREYAASGEERYALAVRDFEAHLRKVESRREQGRVPGIERWLEHDGQIIGCARLRLRLTPELEQEGGHIGYDIRPSQRRSGHGTTLLRLALAEARALGIERILITCDDDNVGSVQVIERNGGVLASRGLSEERGKLIRRYWIA